MRSRPGGGAGLLALGAALAFVIFVVDLLTPLGVAGGVPYVAVVFLSYRFSGPRGIAAAALACSILAVLGYFLSEPDGAMPWMVLMNRAYALLAIWIVAAALVALKRRINDLKKAMRDLATSRDSLELAQQLANTGSWEWDIANNNVHLSENMRRILGVDPETFNLAYVSFLEMVHPADRERVREAYEEAIDTGRPFHTEYRVTCPDESVNHICCRGKVYFGPDGKPVRMAGTAIDLTDRLKTEESIRQSEEKYRTLIETAGDAIFIADAATGTLIDANRKAEELIGRGRDQIIGMNHAALHPEDLADHYRNLFREAVEKNMEIAEDVLVVHKNGRRIPVDIRASVTETGGKKMIVGIFRDISERKRMEERLKLASQVFENSIEGIVVTDPAGVIRMVNPAFTLITGYTAEEAIGNTPRMLRSDRHGKEFYRAMWESITATGHWEGEIWNRRKSGEAYPEWLTISAIKDERGEVKNYIALFHDITEIKRSEEEIRYQAYHDALTGLPNRELFHDRVEVAIARARRGAGRVAVLFIDLDNFKNINDSLGHATGDLFLQGVAARLTAALREEDTVSRFGGDEFAVFIDDMEDEEDAQAVARKISEAVSESFLSGGREYYITTSIGISLYPDDGDTFETLLKNADTAMYRAKERGRNNYMLFAPEMNVRMYERLELESALRRALERKEFVVYYQPKVDIGTGRITGAEALVRWNSLEYGLVPPMRFIPLAEETGLILQIGEFVLRTACAQLVEWRDAGRDDLTIAVNISARGFQQEGLDEVVESTLKETGLPAGSLELEITESVVMSNVETAVYILRTLSLMGIRISVDDFGTGYSSLGYLRKFPIDSLKIDKSFVLDMTKEPDDAAIVATIISMAKNLGLKVIAEGVETREHLEYLRERGCDEAQGYLFSRPVPADEFSKLLEKGVFQPI